MPDILVPLAVGFEEVEAVTVIDLLRRAGLTVTTASLRSQTTVKGAHGVEIQAETTLSDVKGRVFDAVVLPGGMPGTTNLAESPEIGNLIQKHAEKGFLVAAICAAPTVLAKHGLLNGKKATCYPGCEGKMTGARVLAETVVEDGNVITSRGPGTAIPFALKLIERLVGQAKAKEVAAGFLAPSN
jgi:protein deglycase